MDFSRETGHFHATQIVSLGCRCATAHNLRRHFDFNSAFPFDWWISPLLGVIRLLDDSLSVDRLYDPERLEIDKQLQSVRNLDYRILLHHEFPRRWAEPGQPVIENFFDYIESPKRRTAYLVDKFLGLDRADERVLFVHEPQVFPVKDGEIAELNTALSRLFPNADWKLSILRGPPHDKSFDWRGDPSAWDAVLAHLDASLDRSRHKPYVFSGAQHTDENIAD